MKKVLLVTEEWAGSGHRLAASALQEALQERRAAVSVVGGLAAASPLLRGVSRLSYAASLRYCPEAWRWAYARDGTWSTWLQMPLGRALGGRLLKRVIEREAPEVVVATHAYCLSALAEAKRRAKEPFWLGGVLTDFHVNRFWLSPGVDFYIVPDESLQPRLADARILVHGIPVRPAFADACRRSADEWRAALGLAPDAFTVLACAGEGGHGDLVSLIGRLLEPDGPPQIVAVAGRNDRLRQRLEALARERGSHRSVRVHGYVEEMWAWMAAADVVLTKPGGLTCAEALALGKPLLLYQPLPGQEEHNSRFLQERGAAVEARTPDEAAAVLARWQRGEEWRQAVDRVRRLSRPDAARTAAEAILKITMNRPARA